MKIRLLNLLLIGSIVLSVMVSSCINDDDNNSSNGEINLPSNGATGTFNDNRDGKTYIWVKIGEQVWMAENLAYTGSNIQHITENFIWDNYDYDGWCYYENNENYGKTYGVLYQWEAAKKACPSGWHLPTNAEWTTLTDYLGGTYVAGGTMKEIGTAHWISPNTEATNISGFSTLPGGRRLLNGYFGGLGYNGWWWSATKRNRFMAYYCNMYYELANVLRGNTNMSYGLSVRCVRD